MFQFMYVCTLKVDKYIRLDQKKKRKKHHTNKRVNTVVRPKQKEKKIHKQESTEGPKYK